MSSELTKLDAQHVMHLQVACAERPVVGGNDFGYLKVIQISGGEFHGELLSGEVVPGGADWNMGFGGLTEEEVTSRFVFAKYLLKTDDGVYIAIENAGYKLATGERPHIATTPRFHAPKGKYDWLNYGVFVGSLEPAEVNGVRGVNIHIYKLL